MIRKSIGTNKKTDKMKSMKKARVIVLLIVGLMLSHGAYAGNPGKPDKNEKAKFAEIKSASLNKEIIQSPIYDAIVINELLHRRFYYIKPATNADGKWDGQSFNIINLYTEEKIELLPYTSSFKASLRVLEQNKLKDRFFLITDSLNNADTLDLSIEEKCRKSIYRILARNTGIEANDTARIFDSIQSSLLKNTIFNATKNIKFAPMLMVAGLSGANTTSPEGGGLTVTALVDGLAQFLVERANEEINAAVFQKLINKMEDIPELSLLFPNTYELFKDNKVQVFNYHVALNAMHEAFEEDIKGILGNVRNLAELKRYQNYLNDIPALTLLFAQFDIVDGLTRGKNPQEIIQTVYTSRYCLYPENNYANTMKFAGLLSYGLRDIFITDDNKPDRGWCPISNLLLKNKGSERDTILKLFTGLLQVNDPGIIFYREGLPPIHLKDIFNSIELDKILQLISTFNNSSGKIVNYLTELNKLKSTENSYARNLVLNERYKYYRLISNEILSLTIKTINCIPEPSLDPFIRQIANIRDTYLPVIDQSIQVVNDIDKKAYNTAIYDFVELLDKVFAARDTLKSIRLATVEMEIVNTDTALKSRPDSTALKNKKTALTQEKKNLEAAIDDIKDDRKFWPAFIEYANLIASLANAENGAEVKEILNNAALPVGSSRIKKYSNFNLAVNAYPGYYIRENKSTALHPLTGFSNTNGITAPIGLSFSYGMGRAGSFSLFAGLLDIGAIVKYHVENDTANEPASIESEIELGDIFSPGISLVYGFFCNIPLSISAGYQWLPGNVDNSSKLKYEPFFTASIGVDIPMFNLVNRKKHVDYARSCK